MSLMFQRIFSHQYPVEIQLQSPHFFHEMIVLRFDETKDTKEGEQCSGVNGYLTMRNIKCEQMPSASLFAANIALTASVRAAVAIDCTTIWSFGQQAINGYKWL